MTNQPAPFMLNGVTFQGYAHVDPPTPKEFAEEIGPLLLQLVNKVRVNGKAKHIRALEKYLKTETGLGAMEDPSDLNLVMKFVKDL